jgi:hypothetical protein
VRTKFDIYVFITLKFMYQHRQVCGHVHVCYRYRFVSVCTTELIDVCACPKLGREFLTSYVIVLSYIKVRYINVRGVVRLINIDRMSIIKCK